MLKTPAHLLSSHIFRAYDIRGIAHTELSEALVNDIGMALGSEALTQGDKAMVVARDGRLSGPTLIEALKQGIQATGCDVIDIGVMPTPVLYFATYHLKTRSGVMLTGSHNPAEYNGLKMMIAGNTLNEQDIQNLYLRIKNRDIKQGQGKTSIQDISKAYLATITGQIQLSKKLKVVVDAGNGVTGDIAPRLCKALGCETISLFCEIDGTFPNHHPDPSKPKNLVDIITAVKQHQADIGLAFDGDGDRLGVVTPKGAIIWPDRQLMLYAKDMLNTHPGATVIYDVKCSKHVETVVLQSGGKPVMAKTGHSLIKKKMKELKAQLAGEMSGHIFFNDRWYGFDDALYSAARLLEILAHDGRSADEIFDEIPDSISTPEINITVTDEQKFSLIEKLIAHAHFSDAKIITIDGLRVEFQDGWALVRASNTTPCLVLRFEADNQASLIRIQQEFGQYLKQQANLTLPA